MSEYVRLRSRSMVVAILGVGMVMGSTARPGCSSGSSKESVGSAGANTGQSIVDQRKAKVEKAKAAAAAAAAPK